MRILIADDDPTSRHIVDSFLRNWGYDVVVAENGTDALRILQQDSPPRLAILDWLMPGMDGLAVCREVRRLKDRPYIYLLLLTIKDQVADIVEGLEAGADEYLSKPFDSAELRARVRAGCRLVDLQERFTALCDQLRDQATHDGLTGVWNRIAILDILEREMSRAKRQRYSFAVLLADVDHFKRVNDTHGHLIGDVVLREITRRMQAQIRAYDSIGRYGGEEFLLIIPGGDLPNACGLAERIRVGVCSTPIDAHGLRIETSVSIGVAVGDGSQEPDALIAATDAALYRAKAGGRNRVEPTPKIDPPSLESANPPQSAG